MPDQPELTHLSAIDDPLGIPAHDLPDDPIAATMDFIDRVQTIRWELWTLLMSLDNVQSVTGPAEFKVVHAIDDLGIAVRAEAARLDGIDPDPADLFLDASIRRLREAA